MIICQDKQKDKRKDKQKDKQKENLKKRTVFLSRIEDGMRKTSLWQHIVLKTINLSRQVPDKHT